MPAGLSEPDQQPDQQEQEPRPRRAVPTLVGVAVAAGALSVAGFAALSPATELPHAGVGASLSSAVPTVADVTMDNLRHAAYRQQSNHGSVRIERIEAAREAVQLSVSTANRANTLVTQRADVIAAVRKAEQAAAEKAAAEKAAAEKAAAEQAAAEQAAAEEAAAEQAAAEQAWAEEAAAEEAAAEQAAAEEAAAEQAAAEEAWAEEAAAEQAAEDAWAEEAAAEEPAVADAPAQDVASDSSSDSEPAPAEPAPVYSGDARLIARNMMGSYGWGSEQFSCLDSLWNRESGWNTYAENPSSGAYGIPQALPGSKMATAGSDWASNPATQIEWGLGYISARYGTPCSAWAHSEAVNWY